MNIDLVDQRTHEDARALLRSKFAVLSECLPRGAKIAYFDYPQYFNVGDLLIWLGALAYFKDRGIEVTFSQSSSFSGPRKAWLPKLGSDVVIVFQGGGNFGDLYPEHQRYRERIVQRYPNNRVVMLPVSVWFASESSISGSAQIFTQHKDVHLFVRDAQSAACLGDRFGPQVNLCPDTAHMLDASILLQTAPTKRGRMSVVRRDQESAGSSTVKSLDWDDWITYSDKVLRVVCKTIERSGGWRASQKLWLMASMRIAKRVARRFVACESITTDRLHAHILAYILAVDVVVLDNSYGKNSGYVDAWTGMSPLVSLGTGCAQ